MQAAKNLNDLLANFVVITHDIYNFKKLSLDFGKMAEYRLCNQIRVDFYKFRQTFIDEVKNLIEGKDFDFSFMRHQKKHIEQQCHQLVELGDIGSVDVISMCLKEVTRIANLLVEIAETITAEEKSHMQERVTNFQYSMVY